MAKTGNTRHPATLPDERTVNAIQAARMAAQTGLPAKELTGITYRELSKRLEWHIDPVLHAFRLICGQVVKQNPATGEIDGVPNATVYVEDTDWQLITLAPASSAYTWYFPFHWRHETLGTARTDACGKFCAWIPYWDIDWIVQWRRQFRCIPYLRPRLIDLLQALPIPPPPRPGPDPGPDAARLHLLDTVRRMTASQLTNLLGPVNGARVHALAGTLAAGASISRIAATLNEPAFHAGLTPPLPDEFQHVTPVAPAYVNQAHTMDMVRETLAQRLEIEPARLQRFDLRAAIGPFVRCYGSVVPVWSRVYDVPDITFRVTQDINGDGHEEDIYSEGLFDVRWDADDLPDVTLRASAIARESRVCRAPLVVCQSKPEIQFAGMMPLDPAHHDNVSGYARRPNRPRPLPPPIVPPDSTAPFCDNVNLFGCLADEQAGVTHRLLYRYSADEGLTFSVPLPLFWPVSSGRTLFDTNGWYEPLPAGATVEDQSLLFPFNTLEHPNGLYEFVLQMGTGGTNVTSSSDPVRLRVDNTSPEYIPSITWRVVGASDWLPLPVDCPTLHRGTTAHDLEFDVKFEISARHYRNASFGASSCGKGIGFEPPKMQPDSNGSADGGMSDWYAAPGDNAVTFHAIYTLPHGAAQGTYGFTMYADTRAFNPAGADANYQARDWAYDSLYGERGISGVFMFSVVDEDEP
jgi:hypothetical protein